MQKTQNLQDVFLNQARRDRLTVTMFLPVRNDKTAFVQNRKE